MDEKQKQDRTVKISSPPSPPFPSSSKLIRNFYILLLENRKQKTENSKLHFQLRKQKIYISIYHFLHTHSFPNQVKERERESFTKSRALFLSLLESVQYNARMNGSVQAIRRRSGQVPQSTWRPFTFIVQRRRRRSRLHRDSLHSSPPQ